VLYRGIQRPQERCRTAGWSDVENTETGTKEKEEKKSINKRKKDYGRIN
jgi:hypothetical protein